MKVALTGATGFIGSHVARALVGRGETLSCLCRPTSHRADLEDLPIDWVLGDLTDRDPAVAWTDAQAVLGAVKAGVEAVAAGR